MSFKWKCPFCNHDTTINSDHYHESETYLEIDNTDGHRKLVSQFIVCPNAECNKFKLSCSLFSHNYSRSAGKFVNELLETWKLIPQSEAKVFPDYVPKPITDDYLEACSIRDLSPKASAALSRRCLQGIIRDFWGVSKPRLIDEIKAIKDKVDPLVWKAIDAVRKVGNIGAHMEKDINLIIEVDPNEAQKLIELIELLFNEWYVNKHERELRLEEIKGMGDAKEAKKIAK